MDEKTIKAIEEAVSNGLRVEVLKDKDGNIIAQTIQRKRLKLDTTPRRKWAAPVTARKE